MTRVRRNVGLCFDDVLMLPRYSSVLPNQVSVATQLTSRITLNIPLVSAAMDTVTEKEMAIAIAKEGGIGFIHKNMSIESQAQHVLAVKKYEAGVVTDPLTVTPDMTLGDILLLREKHGFTTFPVIASEADRTVRGLVTAQEVKYVRDPLAKVSTFMLPPEKLVTITRTANGGSSPVDCSGDIYISSSLQKTPHEVQELMFSTKTERIVVVDDDFRLTGLITQKDFEKSAEQPHATRDSEGRLRVGAAVGCSEGCLERVEALVNAGVDAILVDSSHGHSEGVLSTVKKIKEKFPMIPVIGGNVCTKEGAQALVEAGADCVKCGIGPGSICTTRIVTGVGCPQFTAILECAEYLQSQGIPLIADGGIRYSGDIAKALAAGASCVMIGSLFAGCDETPGTRELIDGRVYKAYRGMGSLGAMAKGSADRYFQSGLHQSKFVPEGVEGFVPYKGHVRDTVHQLVGGLRSAMGLTGASDLAGLLNVEFIQVTGMGNIENHPHNIMMQKEPPNYSKRTK